MDKPTTDTGAQPRRKHHLFDDISAVQVTATALAAVTSMLLSSYIGFAGSVIGVAVASVVSTLAASLYKYFLAESTEKIKEIPVVGKTHSRFGHILRSEKNKLELDAKADRSPDEEDQESTERSEGSKASIDREDVADREDATDREDQENQEGLSDLADEEIPLDELSVAGAAIHVDLSRNASGAAHDRATAEPEGIGTSSEEHSADEHTLDERSGDKHPAHAPSAEDAAKIKQRRLTRGLIIVCVVSALIAVAATAGIIYVASEGQGIGTKPQTIFVPTEDRHADDKATDNMENEQASEGGSEADDLTDQSSSSSSSASSSSSNSSSSSASSQASSSSSSSSASSSSGTSSSMGESSSASDSGQPSSSNTSASANTN